MKGSSILHEGTLLDSVERDNKPVMVDLLGSLPGPAPATWPWTPSDSYVIVANYASGSVCMLPIGPDSHLQKRCHFIQHEGSSRNRGAGFEMVVARAHSQEISDQAGTPADGLQGE